MHETISVTVLSTGEPKKKKSVGHEGRLRIRRKTRDIDGGKWTLVKG